MSESYGKKMCQCVSADLKAHTLFPCFTDYLFKFLVIGNAGVGKSCILHQFIEQKCKEQKVWRANNSKYTLKSVNCLLLT